MKQFTEEKVCLRMYVEVAEVMLTDKTRQFEDINF